VAATATKRANQCRSPTFCNRREGRAHPGAIRYPARPRDFRASGWPSTATGSRAPVTRLGVELPLCRSLRPDQASARGARGLLGSRAGALVGRHGDREPGAAPVRLAIPRLAFDLPRERSAPSNEPGHLHTARNRGCHRGPSLAPTERNEASFFHAHDAETLDGVRRRTRGRETVPMAQHAIETDLPAAS
jgi:hypothetical protein